MNVLIGSLWRDYHYYYFITISDIELRRQMLLVLLV